VQSFFRQARTGGLEGIDGLSFTHALAMGNSAGGHLALLAGLCPVDLLTGEEARRADAVAAICPITDLRHPVEDGFELSIEYVVQLMGGSLEGRSGDLAAASPITYAEAAPPVLLACGDEDDIVPDSQSIRMANALPGSELLLLPGEGHTFTFGAWQKIRGRARDFFRQTVGS
jgi:dipeptidyl aminopeptidase/acylaminoacyl peptidase